MASVRVKYVLGVALVATVGIVGAVSLLQSPGAPQDKSPAKPDLLAEAVPHALIGTPAPIRVDASDLRGTVVTPHLECPIPDGKNVLWCATFQVAWNELCDLLGGPVQCPAAQEMATALNRKAVVGTDVDEASCIALAGYPTGGPDDIVDRIAATIDGKFGKSVTPQLLPKRRLLNQDDWVAYALLLKELPFEWAFKRLNDRALTFDGHGVETFGIYQLYFDQENEIKAAGQVLIYDHKNHDDFIIELKTRSQTDRLIFAKVQPSATLSATIRAVQDRLAASASERMEEMGTLLIPVLNFDVVRRYEELSRLGVAIQQIRFRLDETGAMLKSEAVIFKGGDQRLIFDKPFLIMIQRTDAQVPYFALWVANAELLVPLRE